MFDLLAKICLVCSLRISSNGSGIFVAVYHFLHLGVQYGPNGTVYIRVINLTTLVIYIREVVEILSPLIECGKVHIGAAETSQRIVSAYILRESRAGQILAKVDTSSELLRILSCLCADCHTITKTDVLELIIVGSICRLRKYCELCGILLRIAFQSSLDVGSIPVTADECSSFAGDVVLTSILIGYCVEVLIEDIGVMEQTLCLCQSRYEVRIFEVACACNDIRESLCACVLIAKAGKEAGVHLPLSGVTEYDGVDTLTAEILSCLLNISPCGRERIKTSLFPHSLVVDYYGTCTTCQSRICIVLAACCERYKIIHI